VKLKYRVVERLRNKYSVTDLCRILEGSRSGYYCWRNRINKPAKDQWLVELITECQSLSKQTYGYGRVQLWLERCKKELERLKQREDTVNPGQMLWGINQGGTYPDLRVQHMKEIAALDLPGYAIGGLAVGEPAPVMYEIIDAVEPYMPKDKPRYLMGVGTPVNIIEAVYRGVDFFDCVMPARNARHGHLFTSQGIINLNNAKYITDARPIDEACNCPVCQKYSRGYIRHLLKSGEMLGMRFAVMHNLYFYNNLMQQIRDALDQGTFEQFRAENVEKLGKRI
jgi:queuine tRNA-ribosyltransferase